MIRKFRIRAFWLCLVIILASFIVGGCSIIDKFVSPSSDDNANNFANEPLAIVMRSDSLVRDVKTNNYKLWLEENIKRKIDLILISPAQINTYLDILLYSESTDIDAFFSLSDQNSRLETIAKVNQYG